MGSRWGWGARGGLVWLSKEERKDGEDKEIDEWELMLPCLRRRKKGVGNGNCSTGLTFG